MQPPWTDDAAKVTYYCFRYGCADFKYTFLESIGAALGVPADKKNLYEFSVVLPKLYTG